MPSSPCGLLDREDQTSGLCDWRSRRLPRSDPLPSSDAFRETLRGYERRDDAAHPAVVLAAHGDPPWCGVADPQNPRNGGGRTDQRIARIPRTQRGRIMRPARR